ncbi:MAG: helix-turn-helix domain-containing protein [Aedoeadaptatus pacaensis]
MARGKYKEWLTPEKLTLLRGWAKDGLSDEQVAKNIGINRTTLYDWKKKYSDISDALKKGKEVADYEVENAMYKSAIGYFIEEEKTYVTVVDGIPTKRLEKTKKWIQPNTAAQIFWLKNRRPDKWRDKPEDDQGFNGRVVISEGDELLD